MATATLAPASTKTASRKPFFLFPQNPFLILLAVCYIGVGSYCSWNIITHTKASTDAIEHLFLQYSMKNEGSASLDRYANEHPFLGMFLASPVRHELDLPSHEQAEEALGPEVKSILQIIRHESHIAAWWSWGLLNLSLFYVVTVITIVRSFTARATLFALTTISLTFFIIGIFAPAMVIWTTPSIPMESGKLEFVLQHEVRGIAAIIWDLLTAGHWIVGGFLLLFSIITPLTKAMLTFFVTACRSKELNFKIGEALHIIGKWSMADVFVAAILLALYALKFQEATKSIPCLGLYYFTGYCLLSMTTTELLVHSGEAAGQDQKNAEKRLGSTWITAVLGVLFFFIVVSSTYTFRQYTLNTRQKISAEALPTKLNNADLVLPAHK